MSLSSTSVVLFGKLGKILEGDDAGFFIKIEHDTTNTGGYYIYQSKDKDFKGPDSFDAWVETIENLHGFIKESNWKIKWFD